MKPTRSFAFRGAQLLATLASVASIASVAVFAACSSSDRAAGAGGTEFRPPNEGSLCTPGQVRECGIEIGTRGAYVDCAKGNQTCLPDKSWSTCVATGATFTAMAPPPKSGSSDGNLGTKVVGGSSTTCTDNPCNPYCKTFDDLPDSGLTSDAVTTVSEGPTISLAASNVPGGFQNKGTLDSWCTSSDPAVRAAACQFDMHCGTKPDGTTGCIPFVTNEKNSCAGIDITAPVVCTPDDTKNYRNLTICNRGSTDLTQNIVCMGFPGNSPQYPNDVPGVGPTVLDTATQVNAATGSTNPISASTPLKAGACRTYQVLNTNFVSNGTESIMCNPYSTGTTTTSYIDSVPSVVDSSDFTNSVNGTSDTDSNASADATLSRTAMTTVTPGSTANNSGWTSPDSMKVDDGSYATASFATATTSTSTPTSPGTITSASSTLWGWWYSGASDVSANDSNWASALLDDSVETMVLGPASVSPSLPSTTAISNIKLDVVWRTTNKTKCTATLQVLKSGTALKDTSGADIIETSAFSASNADRVEPTFTKPVSLTAADIPNLSYQIVAKCTANTFEWVDIDYVGVSFDYAGSSGSTTASVDVGNYGSAGTLPSGAVIDGFQVDVKWRADISNPVGVIGVMPTLGTGAALAERTLTLPTTGYAANSALTSTFVWSTSDVAGGVINASDLTGTFKTRVRGERSGTTGFTLGVDSVKVTPIYRTEPTAKSITFSNFAYAVPTGATNLTITTYANFKFSNWTTNDWLTLENFSSGSLISSASANAPGATTFQLYQIGSTPVTAAQVADPTFTVKVTATRRMPQTGTTTAMLDYVRSRLTYQAVTGASVPECNPSNNWTVSKANPPTICTPITTTTYPPWTVSRVFDGVCPSGTKAKWSRFGYDTLTPSGTKVDFRFRTFARSSTGACVALPAVTTSPPAPLATAQLTPTDTQRCDLAAAPTSFCPVDLMTGLGTDASADCLQMDAYGTPATTPAAAPTLNSWRVTYDCIPTE